MISQDNAPADGAPSKAKIFISYSRKDTAFADLLEQALKARGFEPLIDRREIYALEDWWRRIEKLIAESDTVVFVLSPDAVGSSICKREIAFAASLNKRLAPIVCRRVPDVDVPDVLARLNFIFFDEDARFETSAQQLAEALETNIEWVRKHTEFGAQAMRWAAAGRPGPRGLLLRSPVLEEAERWIASRPEGAPAPTEELQAFIVESRRAAIRRRTILSAGLGTGLVVALTLAGLAYWQRGIAVEQRDKALVTQSRFLVDLSRQSADRGDQTDGLLLALEALPDAKAGIARPLVPEAHDALYQSLATLREVAVLSAPGTKIVDLSLVPGGKRILTRQSDNTVRVFNSHTHQQLSTFGPFEGLSGAWLDPSEKFIVLAPNATVIDAITGAKANLPIWMSKLMDGLRSGNVLAVADDWRHVILRSGAVAEIDPENGNWRAVVPLEGAASERQRDFHLSRNAARVVSSAGTVWDSVTGKLIAQIKSPEGSQLYNVSLSPDGRYVVWDSFAAAFAYDLSNGAIRSFAHPEDEKIKGHERIQSNVNDTSLSPDGNWIATASNDKTVRIWNFQTGDLLTVLAGHLDAVRNVAFLGDRTRLATHSDDGTVRIWATVANDEILPQSRFEGRIVGAFYRQGAVWLVAIEDDSSVTVWDFTHDKLVASLKGHTAHFAATTSRAYIDREGRHIITAIGDHTARAWDLRTGAEISHVAVHPRASMINDLGFSRDGKLAYAAADDLYIWQVDTGKLMQVVQTETSSDENTRHTLCASFSPDASEIAIASYSPTRVWSVATGKVLRELSKEWSGCVRYNPDGRRIATILSMGSTAAVLDARTGAKLTSLSGHDHFVTRLEYSPDGGILLTRSEDTTVRLWNANTGQVIRVLTDVGGMFNGRFTPDGSKVLTEAGGPAFAKPWRGRLWPVFVDVPAMIDTAKAEATRCLARSQRLAAFLDAEPPAWCIEGKKWPYDTQAWRDWLGFRRENLHPPLPDSADWKSWLAAH